MSGSSMSDDESFSSSEGDLRAALPVVRKKRERKKPTKKKTRFSFFRRQGVVPRDASAVDGESYLALVRRESRKRLKKIDSLPTVMREADAETTTRLRPRNDEEALWMHLFAQNFASVRKRVAHSEGHIVSDVLTRFCETLEEMEEATHETCRNAFVLAALVNEPISPENRDHLRSVFESLQEMEQRERDRDADNDEDEDSQAYLLDCIRVALIAIDNRIQGM